MAVTTNIGDKKDANEGSIRVSIFQNIPKNLEELLKQLKTYEGQTDLIVFPELFLTHLLEDKNLQNNLRTLTGDDYDKKIAEISSEEYWKSEKKKEEDARATIVSALQKFGIAVAIGGSDYRKDEGIANSFWIYDDKGNLVTQYDRPVTRVMPNDDYRFQYNPSVQFKRIAKSSSHVAQLPFKDRYINIGTVFDQIDSDPQLDLLQSFKENNATLILNPAMGNPLPKTKYSKQEEITKIYHQLQENVRDDILPATTYASVVRVDCPPPKFSGISFGLSRGTGQYLGVTKKEEAREKEELSSWDGLVQVPVHLSPKMEKKIGSETALIPPKLEKKLTEATPLKKMEGSVTLGIIDCQQNNAPSKPFPQYIDGFLKPIIQRSEKGVRDGKKLMLVGWDFDGTYNFHPAPSKSELLGGDEVVSALHALAKNGCVMKIISATAPKGPEAVRTLQGDIHDRDAEIAQRVGNKSGNVASQQTLGQIFIEGNPQLGTMTDRRFPKTVSFSDDQGGKEDLPLIDFHNIMLCKYKGFAVIYALKECLEKMSQTEREGLEEIEVNFIDDFIRQTYDCSNEILKFYAAEILPLCPNAKININSYWLQVPERPGEENSWKPTFEPLRNNIGSFKSLTIEQFKDNFQRVYKDFEAKDKAEAEMKFRQEHAKKEAERRKAETAVPKVDPKIKTLIGKVRDFMFTHKDESWKTELGLTNKPITNIEKQGTTYRITYKDNISDQDVEVSKTIEELYKMKQEMDKVAAAKPIVGAQFETKEDKKEQEKAKDATEMTQVPSTPSLGVPEAPSIDIPAPPVAPPMDAPPFDAPAIEAPPFTAPSLETPILRRPVEEPKKNLSRMNVSDPLKDLNNKLTQFNNIINSIPLVDLKTFEVQPGVEIKEENQIYPSKLRSVYVGRKEEKKFNMDRIGIKDLLQFISLKMRFNFSSDDFRKLNDLLQNFQSAYNELLVDYNKITQEFDTLSRDRKSLEENVFQARMRDINQALDNLNKKIEQSKGIKLSLLTYCEPLRDKNFQILISERKKELEERQKERDRVSRKEAKVDDGKDKQEAVTSTLKGIDWLVNWVEATTATIRTAIRAKIPEIYNQKNLSVTSLMSAFAANVYLHPDRYPNDVVNIISLSLRNIGVAKPGNNSNILPWMPTDPRNYDKLLGKGAELLLEGVGEAPHMRKFSEDPSVRETELAQFIDARLNHSKLGFTKDKLFNNITKELRSLIEQISAKSQLTPGSKSAAKPVQPGNANTSFAETKIEKPKPQAAEPASSSGTHGTTQPAITPVSAGSPVSPNAPRSPESPGSTSPRTPREIPLRGETSVGGLTAHFASLIDKERKKAEAANPKNKPKKPDSPRNPPAST